MERLNCAWKAEASLPLRKRGHGRAGSATTLKASNRPLAMARAYFRSSSRGYSLSNTAVQPS